MINNSLTKRAFNKAMPASSGAVFLAPSLVGCLPSRLGMPFSLRGYNEQV